MSEIDYATAVDHHRAGRLQQAEVAYHKILAREPAHVDALHGLGAIALQVGRPEQAVPLLSRAVALRPQSMAFQSNLGLARQALGEYAAAEAVFRKAIELAPEVAWLYFNLANSLKAQKRLAEAVAAYRQALQLQPDHFTALNNLGNCFREMGQFEAAKQSLGRAIQLRPDYAEAFLNLGNVLTSIGQAREGEACCREAIRLQPRLAAAYVNLGIALRAQERLEAAAEAYREATNLSPTFAEAHDNLGLALLELGRLTDAIACFRRSVEVAPNRAESWRNLGSGLMIQRQLAPADECYQRAVELQPESASCLSSWLWWQLYRPDVSLAVIAGRHAIWNARHGHIEQNPTLGRDRVPLRREPIVDRPMRLGFVSADFGPHPVAYFAVATIEALATLGFEIVCYSNHPRSGEHHTRFKKCAALWRETQSMSDDDLAAQIAADRIDVLIDLAGHSAGNRLGVFARRPAPVLANWIGSEGTTGVAAMDYLIADGNVVPEAAEPFYCERIARLPVSYVAWEPPAAAPPVAPLPAASNGRVTFGSFNNPAKYHPALVELWSQILQRVPGSRLVVQYRHITDPTLRQSLLDLFAAHNGNADRLEFRDWQPYAELLNSYSAIDIALDPFPFAGGATTCEALWMGVPVVTWPGETFSSRHSCSYLRTIGLEELIAANAGDYVKIAVQLAEDLPRLQALRESLRPKIQSSPFCDSQRCANDLATILRKMWSGDVG